MLALGLHGVAGDDGPPRSAIVPNSGWKQVGQVSTCGAAGDGDSQNRSDLWGDETR